MRDWTTKILEEAYERVLEVSVKLYTDPITYVIVCIY
jgi:hypothetical protein